MVYEQDNPDRAHQSGKEAEDKDVLSPNDPTIQSILNARAAVEKGRLILPMRDVQPERSGWIIGAPFMSTPEDGGPTEINLWIGYHEYDDLKRDDTLSIGGKLVFPGFSGRNATSFLEVAVAGMTNQSGRRNIQHHTVYASGIAGVPNGETVIIAGHPDFTEFNITTTLLMLKNRGGLPGIHELFPDMVTDVLDRSNAGNLRSVAILKAGDGFVVDPRRYSSARRLRENPNPAE